MRALQAGDVSYKEQSAATAARARVELDGVSAEKSVASARVSENVGNKGIDAVRNSPQRILCDKSEQPVQYSIWNRTCTKQ